MALQTFAQVHAAHKLYTSSWNCVTRFYCNVCKKNRGTRHRGIYADGILSRPKRLSTAIELR